MNENNYLLIKKTSIQILEDFYMFIDFKRLFFVCRENIPSGFLYFILFNVLLGHLFY